MDDWKIRLRKAREAKGLSKTAFAKAVGVSTATTTDWEKSIDAGGIKEISGPRLTTICSVLGISAEWLLLGSPSEGAPAKAQDWRVEQPSPPAYSASAPNEVEIPQYMELGGGMGNGVMLRDLPGEIHGWRVTPEWLTKNVKHHTGAQNLRIVTGFGDSMQPLFNPGDPLLVDAGVKSVDFDSIYFFRIENEGFIKRLQRVPGQGMLAISENKSYRDWTITPGMDFEVFARVIKVWRSEDF